MKVEEDMVVVVLRLVMVGSMDHKKDILDGVRKYITYFLKNGKYSDSMS